MQRMKQDSGRKAAEWDMSVAQVRALYALREPLSMRELAERLYLDPSNLTALVDRLEDLGLVQRQADADDRRIKRLVITEKGVHLSEEIIDAVFAESTVFDALAPTSSGSCSICWQPVVVEHPTRRRPSVDGRLREEDARRLAVTMRCESSARGGSARNRATPVSALHVERGRTVPHASSKVEGHELGRTEQLVVAERPVADVSFWCRDDDRRCFARWFRTMRPSTPPIAGPLASRAHDEHDVNAVGVRHHRPPLDICTFFGDRSARSHDHHNDTGGFKGSRLPPALVGSWGRIVPGSVRLVPGRQTSRCPMAPGTLPASHDRVRHQRRRPAAAFVSDRSRFERENSNRSVRPLHSSRSFATKSFMRSPHARLHLHRPHGVRQFQLVQELAQVRFVPASGHARPPTSSMRRRRESRLLASSPATSNGCVSRSSARATRACTRTIVGVHEPRTCALDSMVNRSSSIAARRRTGARFRRSPREHPPTRTSSRGPTMTTPVAARRHSVQHLLVQGHRPRPSGRIRGVPRSMTAPRTPRQLVTGSDRDLRAALPRKTPAHRTLTTSTAADSPCRVPFPLERSTPRARRRRPREDQQHTTRPLVPESDSTRRVREDNRFLGPIASADCAIRALAADVYPTVAAGLASHGPAAARTGRLQHPRRVHLERWTVQGPVDDAPSTRRARSCRASTRALASPSVREKSASSSATSSVAAEPCAPFLRAPLDRRARSTRRRRDDRRVGTRRACGYPPWCSPHPPVARRSRRRTRRSQQTSTTPASLHTSTVPAAAAGPSSRARAHRPTLRRPQQIPATAPGAGRIERCIRTATHHI